jgi:glycosyltransferase involved in cell wall biosynthesis
MNVLYDGWPFVYDANGPAALHLLALLAHLPNEVQAQVAVPGEPPAWLAESHRWLVELAPNTPAGRMRWEQRSLPRLARLAVADLLHLTASYPALFGRLPNAVSPTEAWAGHQETRERSLGLTERLRQSAGLGGLARIKGLFWPSDLPLPDEGTGSLPIFRLPPVIHPAFAPPSMFSAQDLSAWELPETFVLYHGPRQPAALQRLLDAWSWAAGPIGEAYPLVILGMSESERGALNGLLAGDSLAKSILPLPQVPLPALAEIYRACSALFHPAPIAPWGSPVRHALACERPIVAAGYRLSDALVGPAGYLAPADDARALGAAIITVVVEEEISEQLIREAHRRADRPGQDFATHLLAAYQAIMGSS